MKRYGLFVGINDYPEETGLPPLKYAESDAEKLANTFSTRCGVIPKLLLGEKATYINIDDELKECGEGDIFIFFFAGHGADENGSHVLYPFDSRPGGRRTIKFSYILNEWYQGFSYNKVLGLFDACRNSPAGSRSVSQGRSGAVARDFDVAIKPNNLKVDIIYSCREGELSYEFDSLGHGLFTYGLLEGLNKFPKELNTVSLAGYTGDVMKKWSSASAEGRAQVSRFYGDISIQEHFVLRSELPQCPICSKQTENVNTFKCEACARENICLVHQDPEKKICSECATRKKSIFPAPGEIWIEPHTGMKFIYVPGGTFDMGNIWDNNFSKEHPVHTVKLDGFYMGKFPVTQEEYIKILGNNPSNFTTNAKHPVENVSWDDAQEFIKQLNQKSNKTLSLPSESQWEYAAKGGRNDKWSGTSDESLLSDYVWVGRNFGDLNSTSSVDERLPNPFGLHDLSGNVDEWCEDSWYESYLDAPHDGTPRKNSSSNRVLRGGNWSSFPKLARSTYRYHMPSDCRFNGLGFRLIYIP